MDPPIKSAGDDLVWGAARRNQQRQPSGGVSVFCSAASSLGSSRSNRPSPQEVMGPMVGEKTVMISVLHSRLMKVE